MSNIKFLHTGTEHEVAPTPELETLAQAYVAAFKATSGGKSPRGYHPLPALNVGLEFPV